MDAVVINSVIDNIAAKLAVPATELMSAIPAFGVQMFGESIIALCGLFFGCFLLCKGLRISSREDEMLACGVLMLSIGFVMALVSFCVVVGNLSSIFLWLYDPKAWAVKYLLGLIK